MLISLRTKFVELTLGDMVNVRGEAMVAAVTEDGIGQDFPKDILAELLGLFKRTVVKRGLGPETAKGTVFEPFFAFAADGRWALARKPLSQLSAAFDVVFDREGEKTEEKEFELSVRKVRWFTKPQILAQMPWLDKATYWLFGLDSDQQEWKGRPAKKARKKAATVNYIDALRQYITWLIEGEIEKVPEAQRSEGFKNLFDDSGNPKEVEERYQIVVESLLGVLSLQDWIKFKKEKAWRLFFQQMNARRQYIGGKTEIFQFFIAWAWKNMEVFKSMAPWIQDAGGVADKKWSNERTQSVRKMFLTLKEVIEVTEVWIVGINDQKVHPSEDKEDEKDGEGVKRQKAWRRDRREQENRLYAEADWAGKVFALRMFKVKSDINDPMSGEEIDPQAKFSDRKVWPTLLVGNVSLVWSVAKRLGFVGRFSEDLNDWVWTPRGLPLSPDEQNLLWDTARDWAWATLRDVAIRKLRARKKKFRRKDADKLITDSMFDPWLEDTNAYGNPKLALIQEIMREGDYGDAYLYNLRSRGGGGARVVGQIPPDELADYGEKYDPYEECRGKPVFSHGPHKNKVLACEGVLPKHASDPLKYMEVVELVRKILLVLLAWFNKMFDYGGFEAAAYAHHINDEVGFEARNQKILEAVRSGNMNALIHLEWEAYARFEGPKREAGFKGTVEWIFKQFIDVCLPDLSTYDIRLLDEASDIATAALWKNVEERLTEKKNGKYVVDMDDHTRKGWLAKCRFVWLSYVKDHPWAGDANKAEEEIEKMITQGAEEYDRRVEGERARMAQA